MSIPFAPPYYPKKLDATYGKYSGMYVWQSAFADAWAYHYILKGSDYDRLQCDWEESPWLMKIYTTYERAMRAARKANISPLKVSLKGW